MNHHGDHTDHDLWSGTSVHSRVRKAHIGNERNRMLTARHRRAGLMLLTSSTPSFTHSRGFICLLPGVTPAAVCNVGACATLPCPLQDWALHGKNRTPAAVSFESISGILYRPHTWSITVSSVAVWSTVVAFLLQRRSSSCPCLTVAWLLNEEYSLIHSSRCLQPYQASVRCKLGIKSRSGLWLETVSVTKAKGSSRLYLQVLAAGLLNGANSGIFKSSTVVILFFKCPLIMIPLKISTFHISQDVIFPICFYFPSSADGDSVTWGVMLYIGQVCYWLTS